MRYCRLQRACAALGGLAADPTSAMPAGAAGVTPDVRALLAAAVADLEAVKLRAAALLAKSPAGPADVVAAALPLAGYAAAQFAAASAAAASGMRGPLPVEGGAAVHAAGIVAADACELSAAVAMEVEEEPDDKEQPAAAALLMIGGDDIALPAAAAVTAEGAAVAGASDSVWRHNAVELCLGMSYPVTRCDGDRQSCRCAW